MAKIEEILDRLIELSNEGKVAWVRTVDASTFSAVLGNSSVLISKDETGLSLRLLNSAGEDLEHITPADTGEFWGSPRMEELYELARRRALNVDAELDNVLVELNQL